MKGSFSLFFESCARVDRCVLREIIRGVVVPNENAEKKKKKKKNDVVPLLLFRFFFSDDTFAKRKKEGDFLCKRALEP